MVEAQAAARGLRHDYIGTEHILLGLLAQADSVTAQVLRGHGVKAEAARSRLEALVGAGEAEPTGQIPFTPRAKKVLELALRESLALGEGRVLPQHILLGLLAEGEGMSSQILRALDVDVDRLREAVLRSLPPSGSEAGAEVRRRVLRGAPRAHRVSAQAGPSPEAGLLVEPSPQLRRLLMSAGARALDDGRTLIEIADVEEALRRRPPEAAAG